MKYTFVFSLLLSVLLNSAHINACFAATETNSSPVRVLFLSPTNSTEHPFWSKFEGFMSEAASDLGMDLRVEHIAGRFQMTQAAEEILLSENKPDYLVFFYYRISGIGVLEAAEKAGVKSIIVNTDIHPECRKTIQTPREKYTNWLGHLLPDDEGAGYLLGRSLINEARRKKLIAEDGKIHILGLSGNFNNEVSEERNKGLEKAVKEAGDAVIDRLVFAYWEPEEAYDKMDYLIARYPQASVIWSASDAMAFSAIKACEDHGKRNRIDFVVGGVDWSAEGLQGVRNGTLSTSLGGHFMDGARALALLYDYDQGHDFNDLGTRFRSRFSEMNSTETGLNSLMQKENWEKIDFKAITRGNRSGPYRFSVNDFRRLITKGPADSSNTVQ